MGRCGYSIYGVDATEGAIVKAKSKTRGGDDKIKGKISLQTLAPGSKKLPFEDGFFRAK